MVTFGLVDPSSLFRIMGEGFSVDALRGEDRERGRLGPVGGAVFADVRVGARPGRACGGEPAGHPGLQQRCVPPVTAAGDHGRRQLGAARGRTAKIVIAMFSFTVNAVPVVSPGRNHCEACP